MPTFLVDVPSGHTLEITADTEAEAFQKGGEWWDEQQKTAPAPEPSMASKIVGAAKNALSSPLSGVGETIKALGGGGDNSFSRWGASMAPSADYKPAFESFKETWDPSYLPRAVAEAAPGLGADIAVGSVGGRLGGLAGSAFGPVGTAIGGLGGFLIGAGGSAFTRNFGNTAKEIAVERTGDPNAVPDGDDKAKAGAIEILSGAVGAVPLGRLAGAGAKTVIRDVGARGVAKGVGSLAAKSGELGLAGAGTDAMRQLGVKGEIDPNQVAASGVLTAATGGVLGGPRAAREAAQSIRFREGKGIETEMSQVANALAKKAEDTGANLNSPKGGASVFKSVKDDVATETRHIYGNSQDLKRAINADPEALAAFRRGANRKSTTDAADIQKVSDTVRGIADADVLVNSLNRMRALGVLEDRSYTARGKMTGGLSGMLENAGMRAFHSPGTVGAAALIGATPLNPIAYSPATLGALMGVYGGARLADKALGLRSPVRGFVDKFSDGTGITRAAKASPIASSIPPNTPPPGASPGPQAGPSAPGQGLQNAPQPPTRFNQPPLAGLTPPQPAAPPQAPLAFPQPPLLALPPPARPGPQAPAAPARSGPQAPSSPRAPAVDPYADLDIPDFLRRTQAPMQSQTASAPPQSIKMKDGKVTETMRKVEDPKDPYENLGPVSDYAHLPLEEAVRVIADRKEAKGGIKTAREDFERGTRAMLMTRSDIAKRLAEATGLPLDGPFGLHARVQGAKGDSGRLLLENALKAQFNYDKDMNAKITKAFRGKSKAWPRMR